MHRGQNVLGVRKQVTLQLSVVLDSEKYSDDDLTPHGSAI